MKERIERVVSWKNVLRTAFCATSLLALLFTYGCGGESHETGSTANYPTGISEDIEQQLKYDARVDSSDTSGPDLIVNVNDAWLSAPPGMQERSVGQWYSLWHANHSGGVIVQYDGAKIASWTSDMGFKPETKSKAGDSHNES